MTNDSSHTQQIVASFFEAYPKYTYQKKQLLLRPEETPTHIYYLVVGRVSQYDITANGNEVVVNVFKPGAFFAMPWVLNAPENQYFFEASTDVVIRQAPLGDVAQFMQDNPAVVLDLLTRVYRGLDGVLRRMAHLMGGDATTRLTFELLNAAARFGSGDGAAVTVPLTESEIAKHSGLARETVSRIMQKLKADGLVSIGPEGIVISDTKLLEASLGSQI